MHDYIFFTDDRGGIPTSTMHITDQIALGSSGTAHRVFWINTYTRLPTIADCLKIFKVLTRRINKEPGTLVPGKNTAIVSATPPQIPYFAKPARILNGFLGGRFFWHFVKKYDIQSPVLVTNFPCVADVFKNIRKNFPHIPQIYYCVDDYPEFDHLNRKHWTAMEQDLLKSVNGAVFTSRDLALKKRRAGLPDLYLPHGVDYEHFTPNSTVKIDQLESLPKPVVGFYGTIDTWVDIGAIAELAKRFPKCSFVVIGHSNVPLTIFDGVKNIHCTGRVPYSELPQYARYFDVGLIPFVVNDLTLAVNPLKLMEYFALGLPVISTKLPDIADVPGPLYFADTHEEFGNQLARLLDNRDLQKVKAEAQDVAKQNSWSARAEELMKFIETIE
ncbi:glycosyl transferase [Planctomycetales bacterium]|nr:glycosyl transferase [Planctomycetales bacterium]